MADLYFVEFEVTGASGALDGISQRVDADLLWAAADDPLWTDLDEEGRRLLYRYDTKSLERSLQGIEALSHSFGDVCFTVRYEPRSKRGLKVIEYQGGRQLGGDLDGEM